MSKFVIRIALLFLGAIGFFGGLQLTQAVTEIPLSRQNGQRWYILDENPNPDACAFIRNNREERCARWYHVGQEAPPMVKAKKIIIDQMIHFDFDKSTIKKESYPILEDVASVMKNNPQIKKIRIEGHTDWIGTDEYNQKLSERRSNAVKEFLTNKGIDASRMEAVGYGESRPIADNKTAEGRAKNRRTEFNVIEQ